MAKLQTPPGCLPRLSPPHYLDDPIPGKQFRYLFGSLKMGKWMKHISVNASQWIYDINMYIYILIDIWYMVNLREHIYTYLVLSAKRELESNENHTQTINNWLFFSDLKSNCIYLKPVGLLPENLASPWNLSFYPCPCPFWRSVGHVFLVGGPSIDMPFWRPRGLPGCQMSR